MYTDNKAGEFSKETVSRINKAITKAYYSSKNDQGFLTLNDALEFIELQQQELEVLTNKFNSQRDQNQKLLKQIDNKNFKINELSAKITKVNQ